MEGSRTFNPKDVQDGDVVFVETHLIDAFRVSLLPGIERRFVLITHNSDRNIDEETTTLADDQRIIRWFAQNVVALHPKIQPIPIGLENRRLHNNGIVHDFQKLRSSPSEKNNRILYGFNISTNVIERTAAHRALCACPLADERMWPTSREYRQHLENYGFVASPPGNGIDCHRTWEALYLGVMPIVKSAYFLDTLTDIPMLAIEDWEEMVSWDAVYLAQKHVEFQNKILSSEQLYMNHWENEVRMCVGRKQRLS
jgi:hypothetical protein